MPRQRYAQARYWLLTIPHHEFMPFLPNGVQYLRGQTERGNETGYMHWQLLAVFKKKIRLTGVKELFGSSVHAEPSRSEAASEYVWKEDTRVEGTQFELGKRLFKRNDAKDWESIWESAKSGDLDAIPASVRVSSYAALKRIEKDYMRPVAIEREVYVYWGATGVGKSRRAWQEAGFEAYPKDPCTKFWDGYQGQEYVVIDEFRGQIGISHMLRWLDRYPVCIETKGSGCVLRASRIWITSNLDPRDWYPELDQETKDALMRRMNIVHMLNNQLQ